ncbi:MAG TPA: hypothetical protein VK849_01005, partial [Longimicrobiales bacterium]|nr:hypothetical protein [Longimicrobiales bacterium]
MRRRLRLSPTGPGGSARGLALLVLAAAAAPSLAEAQPRPERPDLPPHFAIRGARVVTVSGQVIDNGTVVVSDGVITAVGRNVTVPPEAWVIDGAGKTVYPGLIDAMTTLGHAPTRPAARNGAGGGPFGPTGPVDESTHSWGPEDRPGTHSWKSAAEELDESDERYERWRAAGFTTVVSTLEDGLVTGQAAVLNLGDFERAREMVVATPVAMRVKLQDRSFTGYPNSLLGSFAYLKQLYLDAQHYDRVWDDYTVSPAGKRRPEWDLALEPIRHQLSAGYPVLFPADDRTEVERALATARVMGVRPVVYGVQGAYDAADLLADADVAALVDLDWPRPPRNGDPEADPGLETLRLWDRAPTTPAELDRAGVPFAFYSGDISDPADMLDNARRA